MTGARQIFSLRAQGATETVFSSALFLSAALIFAAQPMAGKMLLPLVGGAPAGWIAVVAFFQTALLAGYLLAHLLSRFPPFAHGVIYIALLAAGLLLPPPHFDTFPSATPGPFDVFGALARTLGLPFVALSASASTLQRLFTATRHAGASDPYFLYASSNLGSFIGLFSYPLLIEPAAPLTAQSGLWRAGCAVLALLAAACLALAGRGAEAAAPAAAPLPRKAKGEIFLLAFLPSALLLAVTTHVTTDIFSAPLVWAVPLGVYLLTFVAAFGRREIIKAKTVEGLHLPAVALALFMLSAMTVRLHMSWLSLAIQVTVFGIVALLCHMRLAQRRPAGGRVTEFYLLIAAGGAAGGLLNAFVFPFILDRLIEYPVLLLLSCPLHPAFWSLLSSRHRALFAAALAALCLAALLVFSGLMPPVRSNTISDILMLGMLGLLCCHPRMLMAGGAALLLFSQLANMKEDILTTRNFYGVTRVFERALNIDNEAVTARYMYHGTTTHGFQLLDTRYETTPVSYYTGGGPIGDIFALYNPREVLVAGLGTGTLACYKTPENRFTFIEIDPAMVKVAKTHFTYLEKCGNPEIITGDARLTMQGLDRKFDMIVLDAFSSDSIPAHLLTAEAIDVYLSRLKENGLLLFNISNRYFNLAPVLAANAHRAGLKNRMKIDDAPRKAFYAVPSAWIIMGRQGVSFQPLTDMGWLTLPETEGAWTDDHTPLLGALRIKI